MGIIQRIKTVFKANANAAIDNFENPISMLDQHIRDMQASLAKVKADTASVMATTKSIERKIDKAKEDIDKFERFAKVAVDAGNDDDARKFIEEKVAKEAEMQDLYSSLTVAKSNEVKMKEMHKHLSEELEKATNKRNMLKSKVVVANTQNVINATSQNFSSMEKSLSEFTRLEEKINTQIDTAFALEEIDSSEGVSSEGLHSLEDKYSSTVRNQVIEDELQKLKKAQ